MLMLFVDFRVFCVVQVRRCSSIFIDVRRCSSRFMFVRRCSCFFLKNRSPRTLVVPIHHIFEYGEGKAFGSGPY